MKAKYETRNREVVFQFAMIGIVFFSLLLGVGMSEYYARSMHNKINLLLSNPVMAKQHGMGIQFLPNEQCGHVLGFNDEQVFIECYERRFIAFSELITKMKSNFDSGKKTILHFGDSSTSGWNSDVVGELRVNLVKASWSELPLSVEFSSFEKLTSQMRRFAVRRNSKLTDEVIAGELLEDDKISAIVDSVFQAGGITFDRIPIFTYQTYADFLAKMDTTHYHINLGVPAHSSHNGKLFIKMMMHSFEQAGVLQCIAGATIYYGNNDAVNANNIQDKYFVGVNRWKKFHLSGYLRMSLAKLTNVTRVSVNDFGNNLKAMFATFENYGIQDVTYIVPVVPYKWQPGLRSKADQVVYWSWSGMKAQRLFQVADRAYIKVQLNNPTSCRTAIENDFLIPRIKYPYVNKAYEVTKKLKKRIISIEHVLPINDMGATIDYCHPIDRANVLLALGICQEGSKNQARNYLSLMGVPKIVAEKEVDEVLESKPYPKFRKRIDWNDINF
jgi:hypothetical protein